MTADTGMSQSSSSRDFEKTPRPCTRCGKPLAKDLKFTISSWFMTDPAEGLNRWQECCKCDFRSDLDELEALTVSVGAALGDDYWPEDDLPAHNAPDSGNSRSARPDVDTEPETDSSPASSIDLDVTSDDTPTGTHSGSSNVEINGNAEQDPITNRGPAEALIALPSDQAFQDQAVSALRVESAKVESAGNRKARSKGRSKSKSRRKNGKGGGKKVEQDDAQRTALAGTAAAKPSQTAANAAALQTKDELSTTSGAAVSPSQTSIKPMNPLKPCAPEAAHPSPNSLQSTSQGACQNAGTTAPVSSEVGKSEVVRSQINYSWSDPSLSENSQAEDGSQSPWLSPPAAGTTSSARSNSNPQSSGNASGNEFAMTVVPPPDNRPQTYVIADRYSVQSVIGKGTLGTTYRVIDAGTNRLLCLKLISSPISRHRRVVKRIMQEVEKAQTLNHPNVVPIYDSGMDKTSRLFYVMDYVEQGSLKKRIKDEGFLDVSETLQIFLDVCEGLKYAHQHGILHRDLKPGNILLVGSGKQLSAKLSDFGVAKAIPSAGSEALAMTQSTDVFADPTYMSPEQCLGRKIDVRSEIYSLGCSMYEALVGKKVFRGPNALSVVVQHFKGSPKPFEDIMYNCDIPTDVEAVVMRMLEKAPENRYQTIEQLEEDFLLLKHNKRPSYAYSKRKNLNPPVFIPAGMEFNDKPMEAEGKENAQAEDDPPRLRLPFAGRRAGNEWRPQGKENVDQAYEAEQKKIREYKVRQEALKERERRVREEIRLDLEQRICEDVDRESESSGDANFAGADVKAVSRDIKRLSLPPLSRADASPPFQQVVHQDGPVVLPFVEESKRSTRRERQGMQARAVNDQSILPGRFRVGEAMPNNLADAPTSFGQIQARGAANSGNDKVYDIVSLRKQQEMRSVMECLPAIFSDSEREDECAFRVTTAEEARKVVPDYLLPSTNSWPLAGVVISTSLIATLSIFIFTLLFAGNLAPVAGVATNLIILVCALGILIWARKFSSR